MNRPIVRKTPRARVDLAGCYACIDRRSPEAARRFRQEAEATIAALAASPELGVAYPVSDPRLAGLRCLRVPRFKNYLICYLPNAGGIDVIRVLHAARNIKAVPEE